MLRFRIPEIFLGAFLAVAIFATGILFSSQYFPQTTQANGTEKSSQSAENKSDPKGFWEGVTTDPVAAFTLGLVLVGAFQVGLFWVQLKIIGESLTDAKVAADAAKRAAKATEDSVDLARTTAERQLRAYVVVRAKDLDEQSITTPVMAHHLRFHNMGQTPAYKMKVISRTCTLEHPVKGDFRFTLISGDDPSVMMLGPKEKAIHVSRADKTLAPMELTKIRSEGSGIRLYTYGRIDYEDAFDVERYTNFCFFFEWSDIKGDGTYTISLQTSEHYNDAN
jgi:hypothetical protein